MTIKIVGAGIGGLSLALALHHTGRTVEVFEGSSRPSPGTGGAFLNLAPNGVNALSAIGLADEVAARGYFATGIEFVNHRGRRIGHLDATRQHEEYGAGNVMVRRADLHDVLTQSAERAGIPIAYDHRLRHISESPEDVTLSFTDADDRSALHVVAADGVRSRARAHVVGHDHQPDELGLFDLAGFAPYAPPAWRPGPQRMIFGREAFFAFFITPTLETWWFSNIPADRVAPGAWRSRSPADWLGDLLAVHRNDPPVITDILRRTEPPLGPWPITDLPFIPSWHTDRVCLMGDAAHATSPSAGQGASLAIEDAVELTHEIGMHGPGPAAFAAFEQRRRRRVEDLIGTARRNGSHKTAGPVGRLIRDLALPFFLHIGGKETAAAYGYRTPHLPHDASSGEASRHA